LKLAEQLLDLLMRVDTHIGRQQALSVPQPRIDD